MKFDVVVTNPPFQDTGRRGKTPHKLWIEFTRATFSKWLADGGYLAQVSPASFRSPNSEVLELMKRETTIEVNFDSGLFFPGVGSSFSDYIIRKQPRPAGHKTIIRDRGVEAHIELGDNWLYLPNRIEAEALSIHKRVMFGNHERLNVNWDYVTCHNIRLRTAEDLSKSETTRHKFPVLHTNRQIWWSAVQQPFSQQRKVMWSRSGYTKPFFDDGALGGTDMVYYIPVRNKSEGLRLEKILNSQLFQYIFTTAKWSGFGNERVFRALPKVEINGRVNDESIFSYFKVTKKERVHIESVLG